MAVAGDIATVRLNINEPEATTFTDVYIGELIDGSDVAGATATLWRQKAAIFSDLVTTSEAGASHAFSDLQKHALDMAGEWDAITEEATVTSSGRVRVRKIVRS